MSRLPTIANPERKPYPSDLSDAEWAILKPLLPRPKGFGHPVEVNFREILNGIFASATHGMPVGNVAARPATLQHRLELLSEMAAQRHLAASS